MIKEKDHGDNKKEVFSIGGKRCINLNYKTKGYCEKGYIIYNIYIIYVLRKDNVYAFILEAMTEHQLGEELQCWLYTQYKLDTS